VPFKTGLIFTTNTPSHGAAAAEEPYDGKTNTVFAFAASVIRIGQILKYV